MICLEEEHIKRFGLTKAVILGVMIGLQKQADRGENVDGNKDFEGQMWFFCTLEYLSTIINLTQTNTHRHLRELVKMGILLKRQIASADRRVLYQVSHHLSETIIKRGKQP